MKFESSLRPQAGISYVALGSVLLLAIFLFLLASKMSEQTLLTPSEVKKENPTRKKISTPSEKFANTIPKEEKPIVQESKQKPEVVVNKEKKTETRKTGGRELGFDLDFGTEPARIIKNFVLPEAKNAGSGRVILKFRFTIRPDGSVAKVFPIMKGNPDLELEAMNLLRKWRFEKLPRTDDQVDQKVEISFRPQ